jgi:hypothetical protein
LLDLAPAIGFNAPGQSAGKTKLANSIARTITGRSATCVVPPERRDDDAEWSKVLTTLLMAGDPVILFDNLTKPLRSAAIAGILTTGEHTDRLLGVHKDIRMPVRSLLMVSGNNLTLVGDMPSRFLGCRIDPQCEFPEQRTFEIDLDEYIPKHRAELIQAALIIVRAYFVAGRPYPAGLQRNGKFPQWDREIRAAVVWAGMADPCGTRPRIPTLSVGQPLRS